MKFSYFIIFRLCCLVLFSYQAARCLQEYINQDANTKEIHTNQENHQRPHICVSNYKFEFVKNNYTEDDFEKYENGFWKLDENLSEGEFYDFVTPKFSDLVEKLVVYKLLGPVGDKYEKIKIKVAEDKQEMKNILIIRKGFTDFLITYCIDFRFDLIDIQLSKKKEILLAKKLFLLVLQDFICTTRPTLGKF